VYTSGNTERIHKTEWMQIKYLRNNVPLPLQEEGERHEEGNSQITEDIGSGIYDDIRKHQWITWND